MRQIKFATLVFCALSGIALLAAAPTALHLEGASSKASASAARAPNQFQAEPKITAARLKGKKLVVEGENFDFGATVLVNGERQKTRNDEELPANILIAKKAGKKIGRNEVVALRAQNSDNLMSQDFPFFGGRTITQAEAGAMITLELGQQFLIALGNEHDWEIQLSDPSLAVYVPTLVAIPGSQALFEPIRSGKFTLTAKGEPRCNKTQPPCLAPSRLLDFTIIIK